MKSKVLVIGSNGQLGKTMRELSIDNKHLSFTFTSRLELDITSKKDLKSYFLKGFDYCINCAAYTNVEKAEHEQRLALKINANAVEKLARECKVYNTTLIHLSTDYVFDGNQTKPYKEEDKTKPINQYGNSKLLGEKYIQQELEKYFIIRTSWLYSNYENNFLKTISKKLKEEQDINIITSQKGTPTSCEDVSRFILYLIENKINKYGIYHFSAEGEATWYDFAVEIARLMGYDSLKIKPIESFKTIANRPKYSVLDNTKAQKIFKNKFFWKQSLKKVILKQ